MMKIETYEDKLIKDLQTLALNDFNMKQNSPQGTPLKKGRQICDDTLTANLKTFYQCLRYIF